MFNTAIKYNISLSVPFLRGKELKYVKECIEKEWISSAGSFVDMFENKVADYAGTKYAISCVNGTAALHIALILAGVTKGDSVIVPTITFIAPVNAAKYVGADPIFMDCDGFLNMDVNKVREFCKYECKFMNGKLINKKTGSHIKAVIAVHVFGNPVDLESLDDVAKKYNLKIIEDAAESIGSFYTKGRLKGKKTGTIGDVGCYSFNGNKIITSGAGGMVLTNNSYYAKQAKYLTTQAKDDNLRYIHNEIGYNYRMTNLSAALGCAQLEQLDKFIGIKRRNYLAYKKYIDEIEGLKLIGEPDYGFSNFWFYSLIVEEKIYGMNRDQLHERLKRKGIQSRFLWHLNHLQKPYKDYENYKIEKAYYFSERILNIPCSIGITENEIKKVVKALKND
ncbi:MAG: LegC family aminotransferase [Candidatus Omnitrophica bacterium]|nr:LegC family aminotransferase [Candidatus Omnitrophota bacterium]MDD5352424.1 LegC family aminotransferase [Candidatus Omnitrophota bacterium]MDD5550022.1 LegC family aminotransferase [Candidatus Omnitrophota bacterium]